MSDKVSVAVIGASGYSGIELLRILLQHPRVDLQAVTSRRYAGRTVSDVFDRFRGHEVADKLVFSDPEAGLVHAEYVFLALPHGVAAGYAVPLLEAGCKVIDLSADFRLRDAAVYASYYNQEHPAPDLLAEAVYGLPEVRPREIAGARLIASPGCYPTSILLPLLPVLREGLVKLDSIVVNSMSGVSGAGRKEDLSLLFVECNGSLRAYGVPRHRHLAEIEQELALAAGEPVVISFVPHLVPVSAGICSTTVATLVDGGIDDGRIGALFEEAYGDQPFVRLLGSGRCPDTRHVVGTNFVDIGWSVDRRTGRLVLLSAEDNLWKGAAGQAVQSFNLASGGDVLDGLWLF